MPRFSLSISRVCGRFTPLISITCWRTTAIPSQTISVRYNLYQSLYLKYVVPGRKTDSESYQQFAGGFPEYSVRTESTSNDRWRVRLSSTDFPTTIRTASKNTSDSYHCCTNSSVCSISDHSRRIQFPSFFIEYGDCILHL